MVLHRADMILRQKLDEEGIRKVVSEMAQDYNKTLGKAWKRESDKAIEDSIKAFMDASDNRTGYRAMLAVLATQLRKITKPKDVERLTVLTRGIYTTLKQAEAAKVATKYKMTNLDRGVVRTLTGEGPFWLGEFYGTHLAARIEAVGFNVAVESGFGREAAGRTMRDALREHFRLRGGTTFESRIPARFAGNVNNYTQIVSANVAQRARVYGSMLAFRDAGFQRYQFVAQLDERTSEICQEMNGRVFTVARGVQTVERAVAAATPEDFMEEHPWPPNVEYVRETAGTGSFAEQNARLESAGVAMPPLHGRCRSAIEAID